mmetsp:Transcript_17929/g.55690  ORF Transcript_17929/g.55690 Transcript_17929/m.55690 type:complete len:241 (-) Transcript_17929:531-1253(-)
MHGRDTIKHRRVSERCPGGSSTCRAAPHRCLAPRPCGSCRFHVRRLGGGGGGRRGGDRLDSPCIRFCRASWLRSRPQFIVILRPVSRAQFIHCRRFSRDIRLGELQRLANSLGVVLLEVFSQPFRERGDRGRRRGRTGGFAVRRRLCVFDELQPLFGASARDTDAAGRDCVLDGLAARRSVPHVEAAHPLLRDVRPRRFSRALVLEQGLEHGVELVDGGERAHRLRRRRCRGAGGCALLR